MSMHRDASGQARILIADDDRLVLSTLSAGLARAGYRVQAFDNAEEAVAACESSPPDLAILDHNMPGLSGLEAAERIRRFAGIPVLMLTAYDDADLVQRALTMGVNGYLVKPIDSSQLVPSIELQLMQAKRRIEPEVSHPALPLPPKQAGAPSRNGEPDSLTFLINRRGLETALEALLAQCAKQKETGACLFLELDHFRSIASSFGQHAADVIVQRAANNLESQLRQGDVLARVGADQFMILLPGVDHETAGAIARSAMAALSRETMVGGEAPVRLSACIGLVPFDGQDDAQTVIRRTCAALEDAKSVAPATLLVFNDAFEARARTSVRRREHLIREALDHDRIELDFQPILDIQGGTVKHYEALLRLRGADGVRVSLSEFLPDAERFGLIRALDYRVLELTAARLVALERAGRAVSLSVNLSGVHFGTPALRQRVRSILNERRFDPRRLVFEVTETAALRDLEQAGRFIAELKEFGCQFALDDFGVGYASFYYLKGLPVDYIKIDGAFVRDLATAASDRLFVKAMVDVARGLGVKTIAEFVNDGRTLDLLKTYGVDYAQGFYIGRPGPLPVREA